MPGCAGYKWQAITFCALFVFAGRGIRADFRAGYYAPAEQGAVHQLLPEISSTDANYDVGEYPLFEPGLAAGDGKEAVETYCSLCHATRFIAMQPPLPAETWAAEVGKMRKTFGASIPDDDAQKIVQYLSSHYTPETRKR